jgi:hypothetical protein
VSHSGVSYSDQATRRTSVIVEKRLPICDISVRLPGIALCPVDAHPAVCVERICGDVALIVSSCRLVDCAHKWIPFWFLRLE